MILYKNERYFILEDTEISTIDNFILESIRGMDIRRL
jgi:hypothetical protein